VPRETGYYNSAAALFGAGGVQVRETHKLIDFIMGNNVSTTRSELPSLYDQPQTFPRQEKKFILPKSSTIDRRNKANDNNNNSSNSGGNQESSRMLFLMYLIHRTWNVVVDGKGKR
jgi:hypothetical protein